MNRGDIIKSKDMFGDIFYKIFKGDDFGQYFTTDCYETALNVQAELRANQ